MATNADLSGVRMNEKYERQNITITTNSLETTIIAAVDLFFT